ncbi:MAG: hypothetical protein FWE47_02320 [Oscillospiraceae bacterium]|nr:hypothetical protein [Oscillospiraceae bacterium]
MTDKDFIESKNLLERLGIIQKVDNEDENGAAISKAATITAVKPAPLSMPKPKVSKITIAEEKPAPAPVALEEEKPIPVVEEKPKSELVIEPIATPPIEEAPKKETKVETKTKSKAEKEKFLNEILEEAPTYKEEPKAEIKFEPTPEPEPENLYEEDPIFDDYEEEAYLDVDKYSTISDLYETYGKKASGTDTIFIIDDFAKSLPDNLSKNIKRQSVLNILEASKIELDTLVNDGVERIDSLNAYLSSFAERTSEIISSNEVEVSELEEKIKKLKRTIKERERLQQKQENAIELETHKIRTALDFVAYTDTKDD